MTMSMYVYSGIDWQYAGAKHSLNDELTGPVL